MTIINSVPIRAAALAAVVALGLVSRRLHSGFLLFDKSLGDALYAVMVYLLVTLVRPKWAAEKSAALALAICFALEAFQATGIPLRHADSPIVRWVLGTTFAWHDVVCYVVGIATVLALEGLLAWRRARASA